MINVLKDQRGSFLPILAGVVFILVGVIAIVVDFGRANISSEQLKTATDAASLAAAKSVDRYVTIRIDLGERYNEEFGCTPCGTRTVSGLERQLIDAEGWKEYCNSSCYCGTCTYTIINRWVEYRNNGNDARIAAQSLFNLNVPKAMEAGEGGEAYIASLEINDRTSSPSVIINAKGKVKTKMLDVLNTMSPGGNFTYINSSVCSQGATYYRDAKTGRWNRPPSSQCDE